MDKKSKLSLNNQHDYITLKTPNGNYTLSWNGSKASGNLARHPNAFHKIDGYVQREHKQNNRTYGEIMNDLLNPTLLSTLWPEWDAEVPENNFGEGDTVMFKHNLFLKKYPKGGKVKSVKRKTVYIHLFDINQVIGFDYQELVKI